MNYKTCPYCGAALDPGERCDCEREGGTRDDTNNDKEQEETHGADQRKHQHDNSAA